MIPKETCLTKVDTRRTEVLPVYVFRTAISTGEFGAGAAVSTIMLLVNLLIALAYLRLLRERR